MKTEFTIVETLKHFGIDMILLIAGMAGGIAFISKGGKLSRFQKFTTVVSGGFTANYLTPIVAEWLNLSDKALYGIAFLLGYGGLKSVEGFYLLMQKKTSSNPNLNNNE